ncbi:coiled-coil domain-containing protein 134-like isoform X6 [Melospiza melodia melodia]
MRRYSAQSRGTKQESRRRPPSCHSFPVSSREKKDKGSYLLLIFRKRGAAFYKAQQQNMGFSCLSDTAPLPLPGVGRCLAWPQQEAAVANMDFLIICPFLLALLLSQGSFTDLEKQRVDSGLEIYKKLFEVKRKDQMNALKNLIELNDINQQYKIIDIMLKGLFKVLEDSRAVLIAADVPPDGPFPQDEKIKDAYSHVVENTAFFGDVVLRFPKIVHHYFDRNSNWNSLIRWGIGFCNLTGVFEQGPHSQVLRLMAQELGISEKSPDYRNPFKTDQSEFFPSADTFQKALRDEEKRRKKEEKRKEIRKGPRISRSQSEL